MCYKKHFRGFFSSGNGTLICCDFLTSNSSDLEALKANVGFDFDFFLEVDDLSME